MSCAWVFDLSSTLASHSSLVFILLNFDFYLFPLPCRCCRSKVPCALGPMRSLALWPITPLSQDPNLQLQTSSWNLYFGFSKRRSRARQRRSGSFWFFQTTSVDGWSLVHPQSGDWRIAGPSKTITAVDAAQCIFAKLETPNTWDLWDLDESGCIFQLHPPWLARTGYNRAWPRCIMVLFRPLAESLPLCIEA